MICDMHPVLEEQILELSREIHAMKNSIIKILVASMSAITGIVSAGVLI